MKYVSYQFQDHASFGVLRAEGVTNLGQRLGFSDLGAALRALGEDGVRVAANRHTEIDVDLQTFDRHARLRPAVADPAQIFCAGLNYDEHRREAGREKTERPTIFLRLASSQVASGDDIVIPRESDAMDFEGEIAIVIGTGGRRISTADAWSHVFGIACYNDASVRDWQAHTTQWAPGKNFSATGAFGPHLMDRDELTADKVLELTTTLNGVVVQHATSDMMIFSIEELIAYCSTFAQLQPGDVIVTGTPGGVGFKRNPPLFMRDGDMVTVDVTGVGRLTNRVRKEI